jgi:hypothetical protein
VPAGELESRSESFGGLGTIIIVTVFGILAILILEFKTFKSTLIVLSVIPLGVVGAVLILLLTGNSLSFTATIGLIALMGIEIKNSILLVDYTNQLREGGPGPRRGHRGGRRDAFRAHHPHHAHGHRRFDPAGAGKFAAVLTAGPGAHRRPDQFHAAHADRDAGALQTAGPQRGAGTGSGGGVGSDRAAFKPERFPKPFGFESCL